MLKIEFFLMNEKGYEVLKAVFNHFGHDVIQQVIAARDLTMEKDYYDEMEQFCLSNQIPFVNKSDYIDTDCYKVSIGWRWIIKNESQLIVFHDSLLPKYRGRAPLINALIEGENHTGVTALFAAKEYDAGDIVAQKSLQITYPKKVHQLIQEVASLYAECCIEVIQKLQAGTLIGQKQDDSQASFSLWRDFQDYFIDWTEDAARIKRTVDALSFPFKGAHTYANKDVIILQDVEVVPDVDIVNRKQHIGKVIFMNDGKPVIVCGSGLIAINEAIASDTKESALPLKAFMMRFSNRI